MDRKRNTNFKNPRKIIRRKWRKLWNDFEKFFIDIRQKLDLDATCLEKSDPVAKV
jgi:hypothetical protein